MINHVQFPGLGIELTVNRVAFTIGDFDIYWYGILFTTAILTGALVAIHLGKKLGINEDNFIDVMIVGTIFGIVGARAYYVMFSPFKYETIWDVLNLRQGGIGIYGGLIAGLLSGWFGCKWKKIKFLDAADCVFTGFLFGQTFGRWANFMNQEAFGTNTDNIFGMISESTARYLTKVAPSLARQGIMVDPNMPVHPTFLYESVWCAIGFIILYTHFKNRKFSGEMLCMSAAWYGFGRFFIEGLRTDSLATSGGLRTSQIIAVVTVTVAIAAIIYNYIRIIKSQGERIHG
ncbi:MAG: prolipoprotein diacylglyceryl transferase [Oscillospiraceae bacterium]|nr:prolipoprotein diacylglyceryl transferase [Oscillospiraceae bacterium]